MDAMADPPFSPPGGIPRPQSTVDAITLQRLVDAAQQTNILLGQIERDIGRLTGNIGANYAEGNWAPGLAFGGSVVGITYSTQSGSYEVTGRNVACRFSIVLTNKGSASGQATIGGLPATSNVALSNNGSGGIVVVYGNMSGLSGTPVLSVSAGSSRVALLTGGATGTAALTDANFSNVSTLSGSFSFTI